MRLPLRIPAAHHVSQLSPHPPHLHGLPRSHCNNGSGSTSHTSLQARTIRAQRFATTAVRCCGGCTPRVCSANVRVNHLTSNTSALCALAATHFHLLHSRHNLSLTCCPPRALAACKMNCHRRCSGQVGNLCGLNQKDLAAELGKLGLTPEALQGNAKAKK
jgi:hypothetical protein